MFLYGYRTLTEEEINERMKEFESIAKESDWEEAEKENYLSKMKVNLAKEWVEVKPKTDITIV